MRVREKISGSFGEMGNCGGGERGEVGGESAMNETRRARGDREAPWAECGPVRRRDRLGRAVLPGGRRERVPEVPGGLRRTRILAVYEVKGGEDV